MRFVSAFRRPRIVALVGLGALAVLVSFMLPETNDQVAYVNGIRIVSHQTHPVDVLGVALRAGGALALILGLLGAIGYARGEMDAPTEAVPPGPQVRREAESPRGGPRGIA